VGTSRQIPALVGRVDEPSASFPWRRWLRRPRDATGRGPGAGPGVRMVPSFLASALLRRSSRSRPAEWRRRSSEARAEGPRWTRPRPLDGSALAETVLPLAESLASDPGGGLHLLRVVALEAPLAEQEAEGEAARGYLARIAREIEARDLRDVRWAVWEGSPGRSSSTPRRSTARRWSPRARTAGAARPPSFRGRGRERGAPGAGAGPARAKRRQHAPFARSRASTGAGSKTAGAGV
jgi:hypothetical protein